MKKPLIHLITNYVTVNDVVNIILACGGSAICADAPEEVGEITAKADALVINIGTPSKDRFESILKAGRVAVQKKIPVVLDPVGAGVSAFRDEFLQRFLSEVKADCIRGNYTETAALAKLESAVDSSLMSDGTALNTGGVDSRDVDYRSAQKAAEALAEACQTVVAVTGAADFVTNGKKSRELLNSGSYMQRLITGSGCMLSGLLGLSLAENPDRIFDAVLHCVELYGKAAHQAEERMNRQNLYGTATYRQYLIDEAGLIFNS